MRRKNRTSRRRARHVPGQKRRGGFQDRVQKVKPEHFAIVPVDCGKSEGQIRVADFYGNVLLKPFSFEISRAGIESTCKLVRETFERHKIYDCVCSIETTGRYHRPIKEAFREQQWDTRLVHPFTTSLIRRSADEGTKTDEIDLEALHRATVDGLAMRPEEIDPQWQQWRVLARHRRDLVEKAAALKAQLHEAIHAYLPGFLGVWDSDNVWESPIPATIATAFDSVQALRNASAEQFHQVAREAGSTIHTRTIKRIQAWTHQAAPADPASPSYHVRACSLWQDLKSKWREIRTFELDLANFLCQRAGVLLLAFPGINVVSASDYVAELGPITNYATSKAIAGRAGLYPARYQSCNTDHADGPLVPRRNRELRAALMRIARNLDRCNAYYMSIGAEYAKRDTEHDRKVVIASRFSRLSYYILAGEKLVGHPALQNSEKILQKLLEFYSEHRAESSVTTEALGHVIRRLSPATLPAEREGMQAQFNEVQNAKRRTGRVVRLGEILPDLILRIDQRLAKETTTQTSDPPNNNMIQKDRTHGS